MQTTAINLTFPPNQRAEHANGGSASFSTLDILPHIAGRTPLRLGFNVEVQEYDDRINLWDWLADSHAGVIREFHPEINLRRTAAEPGAWGVIAGQTDFEAFRRRVVNDPAGGGIHWDAFRFADNVPWLGVPDRLIAHVNAIGVEPWVPMGYVPTQFPRPLVRDPEFIGRPTDDMLDWEAAASAYEYYFAVMHHYASAFGVRRFMMVNEPEFRWGGFYLPARVKAVGQDWFKSFFRAMDREAERHAYFEALATQYGVMARIARLALEDVQGWLRGQAGQADARLTLSGPVSGKWEALWRHAGPHLDIFDYHQYSQEPAAFIERFRRVTEEVRDGRAIAISEFNLQAGEMALGDNYFVLARSLKFAELLMTILALPRAGDPVLDMACVYLFHFPATHRNYKALVYGDMNLLDWTGRDTRLWGRADEWHPTPEEMQVRFATPAYACFRMLARCAGADATGVPFARLETPLCVRDSAVAPAIYKHLRVLTVARGADRVVNILNLDPAWSDTLVLDLTRIPTPGAWAVVRETSAARQDEVTAEVPVPPDGRLAVRVPPAALVQVILGKLAPDSIETVALTEATHTPGTLASLALWQTTRLRAMARLNDGRTVDLTNHNIVWHSDAPWLVSVGQGGLVQRLRRTARPVRIEARLADGRVLASVSLPPTASVAEEAATR